MDEQRVAFSAPGRGRMYTLRRGVVEAILRRIYRGDWPARLWGALPGRDVVGTTHYALTTAHPSLKAPVTIAFGSDFHIGPTTPRGVLANAVDALVAATPDVVLLGGDFVFLDANRSTLASLRDFAASLVSRLRGAPCFAVLGNHDLWTHHDDIEAVLSNAGVRVLTNEAATVIGRFGSVSICGLDDPWTGEPDGAAAVRGAASVRIGLCHSPDGVPFFKLRDVALMLCGHTHGGQVALPGGRPILLPPGPYSRRLAVGRYDEEDVTVIVSRGVGTTELPIRTFAPPEVVVVSLSPNAGP